MKKKASEREYMLCIHNEDCDDLIVRKVYPSIPDQKAESEGFVRIVDESGEDYLYPQAYFSKVHLSRRAQEAVTV
jgi:hypothetical protein